MMHFTPDEYPDYELSEDEGNRLAYEAMYGYEGESTYSKFLRQSMIDHMTLPFMDDEPPTDEGDTQPITPLFEDDESTP